MASKTRDWWNDRLSQNMAIISSPSEPSRATIASRDCTQAPVLPQLAFQSFYQGIREGVWAGAKAASIAFVASAIPTLIGVRTIPWAKANLNYTAQALIISAATVGTYFIVSDQTILECARTTSYEKIRADRAAAAKREP